MNKATVMKVIVIVAIVAAVLVGINLYKGTPAKAPVGD